MNNMEDLCEVLEVLRLADLEYTVHPMKWNQVMVTLPMSDVFHWGTADYEEVSVRDLPLLIQCIKDSLDDADLLFACRKRKMRPQGCKLRVDNPTHQCIMKEFPERNIDLGNPYDEHMKYLYKQD